MNIESLKPFFEPESIAVVGASRDPSKGGSIIVKNLIEAKFSGRIYPINPSAETIRSLRVYPTLRAVPNEIDLVIILTPAKTIPAIMKDCKEKKVKAVIIESAGFAEIGEEGAKIQEEVVSIAKSAGIRIIGPNCTGVINTYNKLITTFVEIKSIIQGGVSVIAQTGMFAGGLTYEIISKQIGLSKVVCFGNKCDVNEIDLIEYFAEDPNTHVIALYLEGIAEGRRLIKVARKITKKKPIIILKGGRSKVGAKAALSHTGSIAGRDEVVNAAFKQVGILQAKTLEDLLGFSKALDWQDLPQGNSVAIITPTGGGGVLAADQCSQQGLDVINLSSTTARKLEEVFPQWMDPANPIDLWPAISLAQHGLNEVYSIVLTSINEDHIDCILLILMAMQEIEHLDIDMVIANCTKPVIVWLFGDPYLVENWRKKFETNKIPVYPTLFESVRALKALSTFKEIKESTKGDA